MYNASITNFNAIPSEPTELVSFRLFYNQHHSVYINRLSSKIISIHRNNNCIMTCGYIFTLKNILGFFISSFSYICKICIKLFYFINNFIKEMFVSFTIFVKRNFPNEFPCCGSITSTVMKLFPSMWI